MALDMTTLARVKVLAQGIGSDTDYDTEIDRWIDQISAAAEKYMNRVALAAAQTEYFDIRNGQRVFFVRAVPVTTWTAVNNDTDRSFGSDTVVDSSGYATTDDIGKVEFDGFDPVFGPKALKITYTGGMAADVTAFVAAFPDIAGAVDAQCAHLHQQRMSIGRTSVLADGASVSVDDPTKWLPVLRNALNAHRRLGRG